MKILGIDGALGPFSAALIDTQDPSADYWAVTEGNDALERGLSLIEETLGSTHLSDVDRIAVSVGPGSFTGLRIALSFAKSLALAAQLPLVAIPSYDALEPAENPTPLLTLVSGRAGVACAQLRTPNGSFTHCGSHDAVAAFVAEHLEPTMLTCCGNLEGVAPRLGERGFIVRASLPAFEPAALAVARAAVSRQPAESPHTVHADYGEHPHFKTRA